MRLTVEQLRNKAKTEAAAIVEEHFPHGVRPIGGPALEALLVVAYEQGYAARMDGRKEPVCPRCLSIGPGAQAGDPHRPHHGPFTAGMCRACADATAPDPSREMAVAIAATIQSPRDWPTTCRRIAERLGLDVTKVMFGRVLANTCCVVVRDAKKLGSDDDDIRRATACVLFG